MRKKRPFDFYKWIIFTTVLILGSCNLSRKGELSGLRSRKWFSECPYGMSLVPQGMNILGSTSQSERKLYYDTPIKTVTMDAFYMDDTEVTNGQYRNFVYWVRDSIVRSNLAEMALSAELTQKDEKTIGEYAYRYADTTKSSPYQTYMLKNYPTLYGKKLSWEKKLQWNEAKYPPYPEYASAIDSLYKPFEEGNSSARIMKIEALKFSYTSLQDTDSEGSSDKPKRALVKEVVRIYPDTLVWIKDFTYNYIEPRHNEYFYHEAYIDYPVVGVNWHQAKAYCAWRNLLKKKTQKVQAHRYGGEFRLPTEAEWEYAASGGVFDASYPWTSPSMVNKKGCYLANFKPLRGDYSVDGGVYTTKAKEYSPNNFNLYDMAGNVSEWTSSAYVVDSYFYESTANASLKFPKGFRKKSIRGGSWKDVYHYLKVDTRDYEYADSARSYIGFRTIKTYIGGDRMFSKPSMEGKKAPPLREVKRKL